MLCLPNLISAAGTESFVWGEGECTSETRCGQFSIFGAIEEIDACGF